MATSKSGGSTQNCRDSHSKRRGVKKFGGQLVNAGEIIIRQCGTKVHPGINVSRGGDYTLYSLSTGKVVFQTKAKGRLFVSVL